MLDCCYYIDIFVFSINQIDMIQSFPSFELFWIQRDPVLKCMQEIHDRFFPFIDIGELNNIKTLFD